MEAAFKMLADNVALAFEAATVLCIVAGGLLAATRLVRTSWTGEAARLRAKKETWLHFASWILLALEFALAADIVRTAVAPTWQDIGQLAAIATLRSVLNILLERDLKEFERGEPAASTAPER